ncbi:acetolactate synthase AlsS [Levilactobacillus koreensis]|uniref:Acetolactate synthase n=1 Tax=Levilactobacillus koreensis TaxID=637971 RepID=A0AAC8UUM5_9LACO|nr:acetolactate synthase AlsS [Levilactobacillus koreensis]AKP63952.1 acetolactate synthase [Levilactobacillus koreensis]
MTTSKTGAQALIQSMINQGIKYVFGIPGAKVDQLFEGLQYSKDPRAPKLIVTRHEQNAALMASGIGRVTGKPGVVATTSGPGVSNMTTSLITATAEGDPVIALGGQVPQDDLGRLTHQSIPSKELMDSATKSSVEVQNANNLSEAFANAYQTAQSAKAGATFISLPQNVLNGDVDRPEIGAVPTINQGVADDATITSIVDKIKAAKLPVILAGMRASAPAETAAIRALLKQADLPVVETFQGAGVVAHDLVRDYFGRVGLFRNQIGDSLLKRSDLVIAVGYDPVEYEARIWNTDRNGEVINIDSIVPEISTDYQPEMVVKADIAKTVTAIADKLPAGWALADDVQKELSEHRQAFDDQAQVPAADDANGIHPLAIIQALQAKVNDDTTVAVDVGSFYIWMARYFRSYQPRHLLFSNGMQTLGVALPWAIAAALERPGQPVVSVAGDGGFLFSGQDLETAVRLHLPIVQLIWDDGYYDMVKFQELAKYGQDAGVKFGPVDYVKYAESFGAKGLRVDHAADLSKTLDEAFKSDGPVVVQIPVDYRDNLKLKSQLLEDVLS